MTKPLAKAITIALAATTLAACSKKEESKGYNRIEGLPVAQDMPAALPASGPANGGQPMTEGAPHAGPLPTGAADTSGTANIRAGETRVMAGGNILQAAGLAFTVDESWKNIKPSSAMRIAQYQLEGSGGPAEMAIFYFGKGQGGGIEDNIRRWGGQFTAEDNTSESLPQVARLEKDGLRLALVKAQGIYDPGSMMPGQAAAEPKGNYALFGLVVEGGPEGSLFVKVTGPKVTMDEQSKALEEFAQSVRVSEYK